MICWGFRPIPKTTLQTIWCPHCSHSLQWERPYQSQYNVKIQCIVCNEIFIYSDYGGFDIGKTSNEAKTE